MEEMEKRGNMHGNRKARFGGTIARYHPFERDLVTVSGTLHGGYAKDRTNSLFYDLFI